MEPLLNLPALRHARMNYRDTEVFFQRFDDIEDPQLAALKINAVRARMPQKQLSRLQINIL
jgi:hypothetical protein